MPKNSKKCKIYTTGTTCQIVYMQSANANFKAIGR